MESGKKEKELDGLLHICAKTNIEFDPFNFIIINSIYKNKLISGDCLKNQIQKAF